MQEQRAGHGSLNIQGRDITIAGLADPSGRRAPEEPSILRPNAKHELPPLTAYFTGRDELVSEVVTTLLNAQQSNPSSVSAIAMVGQAGIGKSALLVAVAHRLTDNFPDAQLYFHLKANSSSAVSGIAARTAWLQRCSPESKLPTDETALAALYRSQLSGTDGRSQRVLVVIDDPANTDDIEALSPPPGGVLIVASRRSLGSIQAIAVEALDPESSGKLIAAVCPRLEPSPYLTELAQLCSYLPIALIAAGSYLRRMRSVPVEEYVARLRQDRLTLLSRSAGSDHSLNVEAVLGGSLAALDPTALSALQCLCVLPVPLSREAGAVVASSHPDMLDELVDAALLSFRTADEKFFPHDLVRELALRDAETQLIESAKRRHAAFTLERVEQAVQSIISHGEESSLKTLLAYFEASRLDVELALDYFQSTEAEAQNHERLLTAIGRVQLLRTQTIERQIHRRQRGKKTKVAFNFAALLIIVASYSFVANQVSPSVLAVISVLALVVTSRISLTTYRQISNLASSDAPTKVLILGVSEHEKELANVLSHIPSIQIAGFYCFNDADTTAVDRSQIVPSTVSLSEFARKNRIDEIVLSQRDADSPTIPWREVLLCMTSGIHASDINGFYERWLGRFSIMTMRPSEIMLGRQFTQGPLRTSIKRVADLFISMILVTFASPILLIVSLLLLLERQGPVLVWQSAAGLGGRLITLPRFRTLPMQSDAQEAKRNRRLPASPTAIGRVLRLLRLDELPLLFAILRGDLSLVGPQPLRPSQVEAISKQVPYFQIRQTLKPGITGWAQVRAPYGASVEDWIAKLQYDLFYVKNHTLFLDFVILLETVGVILTVPSSPRD